MHAKDLINHNRKTKCECGGSYSRNSKCNHLQTKKHNDYLKRDVYRVEFQTTIQERQRYYSGRNSEKCRFLSN